MSRTLILPGLILVEVGLLWRCRPLRGRLPGDIVARTPDEPGKASPGQAIRKQFTKLTRFRRGTLARTITSVKAAVYLLKRAQCSPI